MAKRWWVAGDSLTAGWGLDPDPATGVVPAYPALVGARNGMQVHNIAISGLWMAAGRYQGYDVDAFVNHYLEEGFLPRTDGLFHC